MGSITNQLRNIIRKLKSNAPSLIILGVAFHLISSFTLLYAKGSTQPTDTLTVSELLIDKNNNSKLDLMGQNVIVAGRTTASSKTFSKSHFATYLQDHSKGVLVYAKSQQERVHRGDSLLIKGKLKRYYGKPELYVDEYQVIKAESQTPPSTSLAMTYQNPERYLSMLIQGKAVIVGKTHNDWGLSFEIAPTKEASQTLNLFISNSRANFIEEDFDILSIGDQIAVQGIMSKYTFQDSQDTIYQIVPRTPNDIQYIGIPQYYLNFIIWGGLTLAIFVIGAIVFLRKQVKAQTKEISDALENNKVLMEEIHHRVKNNLAVISGLLQLESMNWTDNPKIQGVLDESMLRINSIAMIHEQLYETKDFANLSFDKYIQELVENITNTVDTQQKDITLDIESNGIQLNVNQAIPCSLIINELVTNAYKHGFSDQESGTLQIKMIKNDDHVTIAVDDNGKGLPKDFDIQNTTSLGLSMVKQLTQQLNGELAIQNGIGARFEIDFKPTRNSGSASNYFV